MSVRDLHAVKKQARITHQLLKDEFSLAHRFTYVIESSVCAESL
jgi:hypothetical protein